MFGDTFDTPQQLLTGEKQGAVQSSWERQPRNCADELQMPQPRRRKHYPVGLKNQGMTCYLNSLLQTLFYTPDLRRILLDLPLCTTSTAVPSNFVTPQKHNFLLGFQRLFSQMSLQDSYAVGTQYLKEAFGWKANQHLEQQDIQQAMRIVLDFIERALSGTPYDVKKLFKGTTIRYKTCENCTLTRQNFQQFCDLSLKVEGCRSVDQSMFNFLAVEEMKGDNQVYCDVCESKQNTGLGTKLKQLPQYLVLSLNRFTFDYNAMERVKVNDYFQFNLEYDFGYLVKDPKEDYVYQLYSVIIHRGTAHQGHYFAYVRDERQSNGWKEGIVKNKEEEKIEKEKKQKQKQKQKQQVSYNIFEQAKQTAPKQSTVNNAQYSIQQPTNKNLLQNWFCLDDQRVSPIQISKLATAFQGSQSGYILFYRRRTPTPPLQPSIPKYFSQPIIYQNTLTQQLRSAYDFQSMHIILHYKQQPYKLLIHTPISQLIAKWGIPPTHILVQQSLHNGLPYYPQFLTDSSKTIAQMSLVHLSKWSDYSPTEWGKIVKIAKRVPFEVEVIGNQERIKCILYTDETLLNLKMQLEHVVPYEKQALKLISTYREVALLPADDDVLLTKLGFLHGSKIMLKSMEDDDEEIAERPNDMCCFIVERDDTVGLKRMYFDKHKTLRGVLDELIILFNYTPHYRLRNTTNNKLYYLDHMDRQLGSLEEELVRVKVEKGEIPVKGNISITTIVESKLYAGEMRVMGVYDPNTTVLELKTKICEQLRIGAAEHKLYATDWLQMAVRSLTREKLTLFECNFNREQVVCLRDVNSPIGSEIVFLEVYTTTRGTPDDISSQCTHLKIEEYKTVSELKRMIVREVLKSEDVCEGRVRVREVKRDYMFGSIWRDGEKQVRAMTGNSNKIVVQLMEREEVLAEDQIVLVVKRRNAEKRIYEQGEELVFAAGKEPSVVMLRESIKNKMGVQGEIRIVKYFNYNFQWTDISQEYIEQYVKGKNKGGKEKGKEKGKGKNKGKEENKGGNLQKQKGIKQKKPNQKKNKVQETVEKQKINEQKIGQNIQEQKQQKQIQKNKNQNNEIKKEKRTKQQNIKENNKDKGNKQNKNKDANLNKEGNADNTKDIFQRRLQEAKNLRRAPILLKDGDWIGYSVLPNAGDDMQTDEDLSLRAVHASNKGHAHRPKEQGGFQIKLQF